NDPLLRREITRLGARLMAHDLAALGINVDCVPVLDVPDPEGHEIIGDRAYGRTVAEVALLGRAAAEGLIAGGVLPVIKHIPGHGRARSDSHLELPVVVASLPELEARDFAPFRVLSDMPMAMTAHVIYTAIDRKHPATTSRKVIRQVIRGAIGFGGLVMSDDLSMKALAGSFHARTRAALAAGCDVVLHCNGDMDEMKAVVDGARPLRGHALKRARAVLARLARAPEPFDAEEGRARFDAAFEGRFAS
ncbi:MAG: glycoside hydrolase family 3 N-terminal domain-containing protein, partial [Phenylobacterium sp.]